MIFQWIGMVEYILCCGSPAERWGPLPATRLAGRKILIEQNIKKRTGPALCVLCGYNPLLQYFILVVFFPCLTLCTTYNYKEKCKSIPINKLFQALSLNNPGYYLNFSQIYDITAAYTPNIICQYQNYPIYLNYKVHYLKKISESSDILIDKKLIFFWVKCGRTTSRNFDMFLRQLT